MEKLLIQTGNSTSSSLLVCFSLPFKTGNHSFRVGFMYLDIPWAILLVAKKISCMKDLTHLHTVKKVICSYIITIMGCSSFLHNRC